MVSGALLCLLAAAEALAVAHALDVDAHAAGEPCKICIGLAGFGSAAPARAPMLLPPPAAAPGVFQVPDRTAFASVEQPVARGPPPAS